MHLSTLSFFFTLIVSQVSAGAIARRNLVKNQAETVAQGWSLQAATCPADSTSCGGGACCPSSLHCNAAANSEVAACCTSASDCRGAVEGSPTCADSSWSLFQGMSGNDFCCEVGMVGVINYASTVAGTCVSSGAVGTSVTAVIKSTGSGGSVATVTSSTTPTTTSTTSIKSTATSSSTSTPTSKSTTSSTGTSTSTAAATTGKPVFFHYLVGTVTDAHCEQDIINAQALGADGFALNTNTVTASWATDCIASLFKYAQTYNFKLFFSFDMTGFTDPNQFTSFLQSYVTNSAHYTYDGKPFVSTFNGGASSYTFGQDSVNDGWKVELQDVMSAAGHPIYFVPAFQDVAASSTFFSSEFPTLDGAMNWNSWPQNTAGDIVVPTTDDVTYLNGAHAAGKTFMMGVSPLQFKHIDSSDNWYRRGEQNLEYRFGQVLNLQPDFVELQTWNDAGESHYMGNSWPEPIAGTAITAYSDGYDHTGYQQVLPAFIKAFKAGATTTATMYPTNGKTAQGVFWHHTLLAAGTCSADPMGKPSGSDTVEDKVTAIVLVASGTTTLSLSITVGSTTLGTQALVPGYNSFSVSGLTAGTVVATVTDTSSNSKVLSGTGPIAVTDSADLCNYNFQVVALS